MMLKTHFVHSKFKYLLKKLSNSKGASKATIDEPIRPFEATK
jgi:hypothetical protein